MKINEIGLALIKRFEGLKLQSYRDTGGILTIGYGHTRNVSEGQVITPDLADHLLRSDVIGVEVGLTELLSKIPVTSNEFSALSSLVFNIGLSKFKRSTLYHLLELGEKGKASQEFTKWCRDRDGKVLSGLKARREAERELFLTGEST
jgi:lysozyme